MDNPVETQELYQTYQTTVSASDQVALYSQASLELDAALQLLYGTTDKGAVVTLWQTNPSSVPIDGSYGLSHAALTLAELEILRVSGTSTSDLQIVANERIAYWYSREAVSRCNDGIANWLNPLNWDEDSRLDYITVVLFVEWYFTQI